MSNNHRQYHSIRMALQQLMPTAGKRLNIMTALISGIVSSKSTHYGQIASKVPGTIKLESRVKSYSRWVNAIESEQMIQVMPFAITLLANLAAVDRLTLVIDGSEVGRKCLALVVSVIYRSRALPLAWIVVKGSKGHFPEDTHLKLMQQVHELIPEGFSDVVLVGDGEFDGVRLQDQLDHFHWQYVLRTASKTIVSHRGLERSYQDISLQPGQRWSLAKVFFTRQKYGPVLAIGWWRSEYLEPIFLVSNLDDPDEACHWYQKRFRIETFFSDQKSRGFHLHKSHLADPARIAHLMLAACLAYIWLVFLGALTIETQFNKIIHRTERCDLSLFQLGLRLLDFLLDHDLPIPVSFTLSDYVIYTFVR